MDGPARNVFVKGSTPRVSLASEVSLDGDHLGRLVRLVDADGSQEDRSTIDQLVRGADRLPFGPRGSQSKLAIPESCKGHGVLGAIRILHFHGRIELQKDAKRVN